MIVGTLPQIKNCHVRVGSNSGAMNVNTVAAIEVRATLPATGMIPSVAVTCSPRGANARKVCAHKWMKR
jgi:hypothetical protein